MRCEVDGCVNNDNGYCLCSSYVPINRDGECDSMEFQHTDLGLRKKEEKHGEA